ncbi:unnamed protein product [Didymodactylos carnosus]|uniref:Uncharacterized protein n=1 Tax=Didymodactylos carnosus TaxID=1234261 RepID=A0A813SAF0_9BILA|nr:unnamed protein product [Didymodactylos carnosus]CAF0839179.1 unnamed protein product [Didymodactylos carnosus]CAF3577853.1 unnamed protein product [Didymodactylos carnosus]CAF3624070.1 unnamed protein product [Didymodactylos carnosus]
MRYIVSSSTFCLCKNLKMSRCEAFQYYLERWGVIDLLSECFLELDNLNLDDGHNSFSKLNGGEDRSLDMFKQIFKQHLRQVKEYQMLTEDVKQLEQQIQELRK